MDSSKLNIINCGDVTIAASCVSLSSDESPVFMPGAILSYARKGQLHVRTNSQLYTVPRDRFVLLRKYTEAVYFKTFTSNEGEAKGYNFMLTDEFIRKIIKEVPMRSNPEPIGERVILMNSTPQLLGLMESIAQYIDFGQDLDPELTELKTKEVLMAIVNSDQSLAAIFTEYCRPECADLSVFMNYHYLENIRLEELAIQSGRSLSTFNREFRALFNESPHKWILRKRLEKAKSMILNQIRPSEVYLQVGFEDLAHFSKAFKKQFNVSPSRLMN